MQFDWWKELNENVDDIRSLIVTYHPFYQNNFSMPITAFAAEQVSIPVREEISEQSQEEALTPLEKFDIARENRDGGTIHRILNQTWFGMPESTEVRWEPGFGVLCDLCSEYTPEEEEIIT